MQDYTTVWWMCVNTALIQVFALDLKHRNKTNFNLIDSKNNS